MVGGKALVELPVGEWFHVEVVARVGRDARGTWDLTVVTPGHDPRRFSQLKTGATSFANLTWVGWSSTATRQTTYYLDNVRLGNEPG